MRQRDFKSKVIKELRKYGIPLRKSIKDYWEPGLRNHEARFLIRECVEDHLQEELQHQ